MEPESIKVVLLGDAGVGKTCIVKQFVEHTFNAQTTSSLTAQFVSKTIDYIEFNKAIKFDIWDTVGQERFRSLAKIFYKNSKVIIFVYDITSLKSFEDLRNYWYKEVRDNCDEIPTLAIVGNKSDLYNEKKVDVKDVKDFAKQINAIFQLTSAKTSDGIENLFQIIGKKYLMPNYEYDAGDKLAKEKYDKIKNEEKNTKIRIKKGNNNSDQNDEMTNNEKTKKGCC